MLMNITEDQSINGAMMLCSSGASSATRAIQWFKRYRATKEATAEREAAEATKTVTQERYAEIVSAYRGGYVAKPDDPATFAFIHDIGGTDLPADRRTFIFHGDKSDLSYFWSKASADSNTVLLRSYIESIRDNELQRRVLANMTRYCEQGVLTYQEGAYAITDKGKQIIYDLNFIEKRLAAEEGYFSKLETSLKKSGIKGVSKGDQFYVFAMSDKEPLLMTVQGGMLDGENLAWVKMNGDPGDILIPMDGIGTIAFADVEQGRAYVEANPGEVGEWQKMLKMELDALRAESKEVGAGQETDLSFSGNWNKDDHGDYLIPVENREYEHLKVPAGDVREHGNEITFTIHPEQTYVGITGQNRYQLNGMAVRDLLSESGAKSLFESSVSTTVHAATTTATTAASAAVAAVDSAATCIPPAKAVTAAAQAVYKVAQGINAPTQGTTPKL